MLSWVVSDGCVPALQQYYNGSAPYKYIPVIAFTKAFQQTPWARQTLGELSEPYQAPNEKCMSALITYKYALSRECRAAFCIVCAREVQGLLLQGCQGGTNKPLLLLGCA